MSSLRTLFLGVHASSWLIRALFLPLWYVALLSPFILAVAWYLGLGKAFHRFIPEDFSWFDILPQIAILSVFMLLPTRLLSTSGASSVSRDGKRRIQSLPYWIPWIRNLTSVVFGGETWLRSARDSSITSVIAYKAAGSKHNLILTDSLLENLYENKSGLVESRDSKWVMLHNAYNMPHDVEDQASNLMSVFSDTFEKEMIDEKLMEALIKPSLRMLSESLPDFITFNSSIVDQMQWERVANIELTDGTSEAECDLFMLINDFCCNAILPPIVGAQFTESYQLLAMDLATFNQKFWALGLGLPRMSPIKGLPGAALARKRLSKKFTRLFDDLTNPPVRRVPADDESLSGEEDTDADIATPFTKLNDLFSKHSLSMDVRAAIGLQFVHSIVADVVPLVFWTVFHVYSASTTKDAKDAKDTPLEKIKDETKAWAEAVQPPSIHPSFPAPPEIRYASASDIISVNNFPLLRSCIYEARRLYSCSMSTYVVKTPITLENTRVARPGELEKWELDVGSYIDIGLSQTLINTSPSHHLSPSTFKPDRFIDQKTPTSIRTPEDTTQPYRSALVASLVAGITQLWEITPAPKKSFIDRIQEAGAEASMGAAALSGEQNTKKDGPATGRKIGEWISPKASDGISIKVPKSDIRVRIRRRENLPSSKIVGRIG